MAIETRGIGAALLRGEAGRFEVPGQAHHILTIHAAGRIGQEIACDGRSHRRELTPGDTDLIQAGAPLGLADEAPSEVLAIMVPTALVQREVEGLDLRETAFRPLLGFRDPQLARLAWALHRRRGQRRDLYDDCLDAEVARRLVWRQDPRARTAPPRSEPLDGRRARRVLDYIDAHLDQPISIQELAIEAGLGATVFKAAFRNTFASPVHRHLVRRRAERARLLLLEGDLPASQVALEAGFTHQTHMARWLRRLFGVLPSDLARAARIDRVSPPRRTLLDQSH